MNYVGIDIHKRSSGMGKMGSRLTFDISALTFQTVGMARPLRLEFEDAIYHLLGRAVRWARELEFFSMTRPRRQLVAAGRKIAPLRTSRQWARSPVIAVNIGVARAVLNQ